MAYKKKVFVSYDYDNDKHYKNLLLAWDGNKHFDFSINDHSADVSINSSNATAIKSVISRYINEATYFLVIVGPKTHKSAWVKWEINKAVELKKRIVAVKTDRENTSPYELLGIGATWAMSFTYDAISKAIDNA
ncbi:MAG TPA: TIR domain-containing protein [Bacteroidales bacterium]|nr:TIR domain-containing protein [Bacteroidales bacterium]HOR81940.1 TIR domain-containing protein [Bacteroidales bacterium]HPJ91172.1 TIR domain-containing protein [Bacteroidales bacterium]